MDPPTTSVDPPTTSVDPPTTSGPSVDPPTTSGPSVGVDVPSFVVTKLGNFMTISNEVSGAVFALGENLLLFQEFNYDGKGLAPIFLAGTTGTPGGDGEVGHTHRTNCDPVVFQVELPFPLETEKRDFKFHLKLPEGFTVAQLE